MTSHHAPAFVRKFRKPDLFTFLHSQISYRSGFREASYIKMYKVRKTLGGHSLLLLINPFLY